MIAASSRENDNKAPNRMRSRSIFTRTKRAYRSRCKWFHRRSWESDILGILQATRWGVALAI